MNKEKLEYFRQLLLERKRKLLDGAKEAIEDKMYSSDQRMGDFADKAIAESDRNLLLRFRDRERKLIKKIDEALERIEQGTFGICEECGCEISDTRLKVRPVTTMCIECKTEAEEKESG